MSSLAIPPRRADPIPPWYPSHSISKVSNMNSTIASTLLPEVQEFLAEETIGEFRRWETGLQRGRCDLHHPRSRVGREVSGRA